MPITFVFISSFATFISIQGSRVLMCPGWDGFTASPALPLIFPARPMRYVTAPLIGFTTMLFVVATQNLAGML